MERTLRRGSAREEWPFLMWKEYQKKSGESWEVCVTTHFRPPGSLQQSQVHPNDRAPKREKDQCSVSSSVWCLWRRLCGWNPAAISLEGAPTYSPNSWATQFCGVGPHGRHRVDLESFEILEREQDWQRRGIREAIWVKQLQNKSGGLSLGIYIDNPKASCIFLLQLQVVR